MKITSNKFPTVKVCDTVYVKVPDVSRGWTDPEIL